MEGSKKFNDIMKHHHNRNSNKKNVTTSLIQIIQKQNRCELKRPRSTENAFGFQILEDTSERRSFKFASYEP